MSIISRHMIRVLDLKTVYYCSAKPMTKYFLMMEFFVHYVKHVLYYFEILVMTTISRARLIWVLWFMDKESCLSYSFGLNGSEITRYAITVMTVNTIESTDHICREIY